MLEIMESIIKNVLTMLYQQLGFSITLAILYMFLYMFAKEHGWGNTIKEWWLNFRTNGEFQRTFLFALCVAMVLFCTLFNRDLKVDPLSQLLGGWGLYKADGNLTTRAIENVILFIPLISLMFWNFHQKIFRNKFIFIVAIGKSFIFSLAFSLGIEFSQLFFRLGTFQVSDLCYNILGGIIGGTIYWCCYKVTQRIKKRRIRGGVNET